MPQISEQTSKLYESVDRARKLCPASLTESQEKDAPVSAGDMAAALAIAARPRPVIEEKNTPPQQVFLWG